MLSPISRFRTLWGHPSTRELLLWCLPALVLGLTLRVLLMVQMPHALFHDDSADLLITPERLIFDQKFELHAKKTFLVPIVFSIPFLLHLPALVAIPVMQHLLGLAMILLVGLLCRLWFTNWKWFILPLTVLVAANPFLLWYEHTLMAETLFVFCTVLVALAGTLYALEQTRARFIFLCIALFLEAGARPEGKLLFGFGIFLVGLLHWRESRRHLPRILTMLALALATHFVTKTAQAGLLLYTSMARLTPLHLTSAPGFEPFIQPLRTDLQERWNEKPSFPKVRDRRAVAEAVQTYLKANPQAGVGKSHRCVNDFCLKVAMETCWRNLAYLPIHAYHKFRYVSNDSPAGLLDNDWLFRKQREAYSGSFDEIERLTAGLTGSAISSEAELNHFIDTHYSEVPWFNALQDRWLNALNTLRFSDQTYPDSKRPKQPFIYSGVPFYFFLAALGLLSVTARKTPLQPFHLAWGITLLGFFFIVMLTGNVRPRFRFVFEPFWFLYIALLMESLWLSGTRLLRK